MLSYKNLNESNKEKYYCLYKLGKINFDLTSCIDIIDINISSYLSIYISQQFYIHNNEAIKFLRDNTYNFNKYLDSDFRNSCDFDFLINEMNFNNFETEGNKFIKTFRDNSIHYRDQDRDKLINIECFCEVIKEFSSYFPEIESEFSMDRSIEEKSAMIHLNMFIIQKSINIKEYSKTMISLSESLLKYTRNIIKNLLKELEE